MKSWKITFTYSYLAEENEYGQRGRIKTTLTQIIVCEQKSLAMCHITQVYGHSEDFQFMSAEAGPEIYAIISVNHGLGPVNR